jgi:hypothetical protein
MASLFHSFGKYRLPASERFGIIWLINSGQICFGADQPELRGTTDHAALSVNADERAANIPAARFQLRLALRFLRA